MKLRNNEMLMQIRTGMKVYDRNQEQVGTIEYVQFTDEDPGVPGPETATTHETDPYQNSFVEDIAKALGGGDDLPEEIRQKLLREGFIKIETGLLTSDVFVLPNQISGVTHNRVDLDVTRDELISA